ncbi:L-serine ammonia-lyase, iron-sulfur-dependent, subunit alpha, partial [Plesiomonas shigelloides]|nr:L-serine ammonia-lyase, iron-sulfur-dependent, subunit alpha [Plesiomonas shigelloides]
SISGAEAGRKGEVGAACSLPAAGLAEQLGSSPQHACVPAALGLAHHLGLTSDPVAGQVQVPRIERNAIASMNALTASRLPIRPSRQPRPSLYPVLHTMLDTANDIPATYSDTSRPGLALNVVHTASFSALPAPHSPVLPLPTRSLAHASYLCPLHP